MTVEEQTHQGEIEVRVGYEAEANVFATHPTGFRVHFKLINPDGQKVVTRLESLISVLVEKGYGFDGAPPIPNNQAPQSAGPTGVAQWLINADGSRSCSVHGPAKWVPPGTSRNTGKPYSGFWSCQDRSCRPKGED